MSAVVDRVRRRGNPAADPAGELRSEDMKVHFGGVRAVDGVDCSLRRGEIVGLIGPNGAGKTTLLNALSGFQQPTAGRVFLGGLDVTGWPPHRLGRMGLVRTFQGVRVFGNLTVFRNVEVAALGVGCGRREARARAWALLERFQLSDKARMPARALPYGEERRIGLLRALATTPGFLLLDEPAAGLNEVESDELTAAIGLIRTDFGCGILVIEHDMRLIMKLCDRIQVLDYGKTISMGTPAEVQADAAVVTAYLGSKGAPVAGD